MRFVSELDAASANERIVETLPYLLAVIRAALDDFLQLAHRAR